MQRAIISLLMLCVLAIRQQVQAAGKLDYTILEVYANSTDTSLCDIELKLERVSRGVYMVTGYFDLKIPASEDFRVALELSRSATGVGNFMPALLTDMSSRPLRDFFNETYRQYLMEDLHNCSNFPYFGPIVELPLPPTNFIINRCMLTTDTIPDYIPPGYYKFIVRVIQNFEVYTYFLLHVEKKPY